MKDCLFCQLDRQTLFENQHVMAIEDKYPISKGHILIIPKRHIESVFEVTKTEWLEIHDLIKRLKKRCDALYQPDGYNIAINNGTAAGQTVFHLHVHMIPRYEGDVDDPAGGVRGIIPGKQKYP